MATKKGTERIGGTVTRLLRDKGFGFIREAEGGERFFHHTSVRGVAFADLHEGQQVTFVQAEGPKGPRAEDVEA